MKNLSTEHPLDKHLKPVKDSDGNNSSLEISTEKVRVKDLEVTGTTTGIETGTSITVDSSLTDGSTNPVENNAVFDGLATKLNLSGGTMTGDISHAGDFALDVGGSIELNADTMTTGNGIQFKDAAAKFADFQVHHSATWLYLYENGGVSNNDYFAIECLANGEATLRTNDNAATAAHLTLDIDGDIALDSASGNFIAKKGGTEFSAANSSYAGMILGYRDIGLNEAEASYNMTTSYAVPTDEFGVTFVAPPSGNVEYVIENIWVDYGGSGSGDFYIGLSTANSTSGYSALASYHEKNIGDNEGRYAQNVSSVSWTLTGLTPGTSYTYYVGFKSSSTSGTPHISWGGDATGKSPDIIIKAIALPVTIST